MVRREEAATRLRQAHRDICEVRLEALQRQDSACHGFSLSDLKHSGGAPSSFLPFSSLSFLIPGKLNRAGPTSDIGSRTACATEWVRQRTASYDLVERGRVKAWDIGNSRGCKKAWLPGSLSVCWVTVCTRTIPQSRSPGMPATERVGWDSKPTGSENLDRGTLIHRHTSPKWSCDRPMLL